MEFRPQKGQLIVMSHYSSAGFAKIGAVIVVTAGLGSALSGCAGFDGVELQGGLFDAMGVSGSANRKAKEPKVAQRSGLIIPPSTQALPSPGSGQIASQGNQSWPNSPEQAKIAKIAYKKQQLSKYCDDRKWWMQANPDEFNRATNNGDLCVSGIAKAYKKNQ